ncbi:hypothetical protein HWA77_04455 [Photobacterium damselae subsp. damselae]|uniref:Uncharacterized protein n=1 Tax=Photobacterium damselae subsp. damselae TaxID=85581 RepID=A0A850QSV7_PHODD|nr:hypothetical protein [Photobacterium damselae subsp. damselae]
MLSLVQQRFNAFVNGKKLYDGNKPPLEIWSSFVSKLRELNDRKPDEEVEEWLFFQ